MSLRWLTNLYDPKAEDFDLHVKHQTDETHEEAVRNIRRWLEDKVIGDPEPSELYSSTTLRRMGMVGIYVRE